MLRPDDDLSIWMCTIALAHNDLVTTHLETEKADHEWERFYFWRVAIGHYSEIMLCLERMGHRPAVSSFIGTATPEVQRAYEAALALYEKNRRVATQLRNEAIFHYPNPKGVKAMRRALRNPELQDGQGGVTSKSGKVRDTRMHYADEVMAAMVMNATGGAEEKHGEASAALGEAVAAFMRFANLAQDEFFMQQPAGVVTSVKGKAG